MRTAGSLSRHNKKEVNEMTIAMRIAEMLDYDGECWETDDGRDLDALAGEAGATVTHDDSRDLTRYLFPDGSAIVAGVGGWDIEGDEPFSWAGDVLVIASALTRLT